ncbi:hypothetical protein BLOT_011086 [Blomia tropicalis]|nr:hypothetical protein BLOT_011086 [Blomia tropicalis]
MSSVALHFALLIAFHSILFVTTIRYKIYAYSCQHFFCFGINSHYLVFANQIRRIINFKKFMPSSIESILFQLLFYSCCDQHK